MSLTVEGPDASAAVPADASAAVGALLADPELVRLALQPIADLRQGTVAGWEALMRAPAAWRIAPDVLFAAANELGHSAQLEHHVLVAGMELFHQRPPNTFLTLNVDPGHLLDQHAMAPVRAAGNLSGLILEVTEHAWPDNDGVKAVLDELRGQGATIAADDVGAGYASLNQLMRLRPQIVKLDRELITGLGIDAAATSMIAALGELCGSLDAWIIAEGVEDEGQLTALARLGVPLAQGWLLGRPAPGWPGLDDPDLVRERTVMGTISESVVSLISPLPPDYHRDHTGKHFLGADPTPCTTVAPSLGLARAVSLVVNRAAAQRWQPLIVTAASGHALGLVPLEPLFVAAAGA